MDRFNKSALQTKQTVACAIMKEQMRLAEPPMQPNPGEDAKNTPCQFSGASDWACGWK